MTKRPDGASYSRSPFLGWPVIAVTSVRSKRGSAHNGHIGCRLTTGSSGRRSAPPLNQIFSRPNGGIN